MPRTLAVQQPSTETPCTSDLVDAADESIGRLTVAKEIIDGHRNGVKASGGWDLATPSETIHRVIERLNSAKSGDKGHANA
jgi:hypothetical protein